MPYSLETDQSMKSDEAANHRDFENFEIYERLPKMITTAKAATSRNEEAVAPANDLVKRGSIQQSRPRKFYVKTRGGHKPSKQKQKSATDELLKDAAQRLQDGNNGSHHSSSFGGDERGRYSETQQPADGEDVLLPPTLSIEPVAQKTRKKDKQKKKKDKDQRKHKQQQQSQQEPRGQQQQLKQQHQYHDDQNHHQLPKGSSHRLDNQLQLPKGSSHRLDHQQPLPKGSSHRLDHQLQLPKGSSHRLDHQQLLPKGSSHRLDHQQPLSKGSSHRLDHQLQLPKGSLHRLDHQLQLPAGSFHREHQHQLPQGSSHIAEYSRSESEKGLVCHESFISEDSCAFDIILPPPPADVSPITYRDSQRHMNQLNSSMSSQLPSTRSMFETTKKRASFLMFNMRLTPPSPEDDSSSHFDEQLPPPPESVSEGSDGEIRSPDEIQTRALSQRDGEDSCAFDIVLPPPEPDVSPLTYMQSQRLARQSVRLSSDYSIGSSDSSSAPPSIIPELPPAPPLVANDTPAVSTVERKQQTVSAATRMDSTPIMNKTKSESVAPSKTESIPATNKDEASPDVDRKKAAKRIPSKSTMGKQERTGGKTKKKRVTKLRKSRSHSPSLLHGDEIETSTKKEVKQARSKSPTRRRQKTKSRGRVFSRQASEPAIAANERAFKRQASVPTMVE